MIRSRSLIVENTLFYFGVIADISFLTLGLILVADFNNLPAFTRLGLLVVGVLALISGGVAFGYLISKGGVRPWGLGFLVFVTWLGLLITLIGQMLILGVANEAASPAAQPTGVGQPFWDTSNESADIYYENSVEVGSRHA